MVIFSNYILATHSCKQFMRSKLNHVTKRRWTR